MSDLEYPTGLTEITSDVRKSDAVSYVHFNIMERLNAKEYQPHKSILLYMPETVVSPLSTSWDGVSAGLGGAQTTGDQIDKVDSLIDKATYSIDELVNSIKSKALGGSELSGEDITAIKEQRIKNPYMKMLFRGVSFRTFDMNFKFTPHSEAESKIIWQICQEFRAAALPEEEPGGFRWRYPREIEVSYMYKGKQHPWLNKFKRCVLTNASVNYASQGYYASMRNGFPVQTVLNLQFTEIEQITRGDISVDDAEPSF